MKNRQVKDNGFGQKTTEGILTLKSDTEMRNLANDGEYPWNKKRWKYPSNIIVPKGTEVIYRGQETRSSYVHNVYFQTSEGRFCATKLDKNHPCTTEL